jgi:hypothetical protein
LPWYAAGALGAIFVAHDEATANTPQGEAKMEAHRAYEKSEWRRVDGAVIHCVAGDGLGIMTAMVIARPTGMSFWQEFWFEYAVGFGFGWFIFQLKSMTMMTDSWRRPSGWRSAQSCFRWPPSWVEWAR